MTTGYALEKSPQYDYAAAVLDEVGIIASEDELQALGNFILDGLVEIQGTTNYTDAAQPGAVLDAYFNDVTEHLKSGFLLAQIRYKANTVAKTGSEPGPAEMAMAADII